MTGRRDLGKDSAVATGTGAVLQIWFSTQPLALFLHDVPFHTHLITHKEEQSILSLEKLTPTRTSLPLDSSDYLISVNTASPCCAY